MNILYTIPSLEVGGAEIFLARLATQLTDNYHTNVYILDFEKEKRDEKIVELFSKKVKFISNPYGSKQLNRFIEKLELIFKLPKYKLSNALYARFINKLIRKYNLHVLHSHLYRSDKIVSNSKIKINKIVTLHGCYNSIGQNRVAETETILSAFDKIVYISNRNIEMYHLLANKAELSKKTLKIYNGIELLTLSKTNEEKQSEATQLVVVSRCIKEKGWDTVIKAAIKLYNSNVKVNLNLVGDGEYLSELKSKYQHYKFINFVGATTNIGKYISEASICCFPSVYPHESFPNTILEYMVYGKTILSNDIGEVKSMMTNTTGEICGYIAPLSLAESELVEFYVDKIQLLVHQPNLIEKFNVLALANSKKFDIRNSVNAYLELYNNFERNKN